MKQPFDLMCSAELPPADPALDLSVSSDSDSVSDTSDPELSSSAASSSAGSSSAGPAEKQSPAESVHQKTSADTEGQNPEEDLSKEDLPAEAEDAKDMPPAEADDQSPTSDNPAPVLPEQSSVPTASGESKAAEDHSLTDQQPESNSVSPDFVSGENPEETFVEEAFSDSPPAEETQDGDLYALVLEGFQVTNELMMIQIGLLAVLFAMFVFRFVYRLISNMVTKF